MTRYMWTHDSFSLSLSFSYVVHILSFQRWIESKSYSWQKCSTQYNRCTYRYKCWHCHKNITKLKKRVCRWATRLNSKKNGLLRPFHLQKKIKQKIFQFKIKKNAQKNIALCPAIGYTYTMCDLMRTSNWRKIF